MNEIEYRYFWEELQNTPWIELMQQVCIDENAELLEEIVWGNGRNYSVTINTVQLLDEQKISFIPMPNGIFDASNHK